MTTKTITRNADGSLTVVAMTGSKDKNGLDMGASWEISADQVDAHRQDATFIDVAADNATKTALDADKATRAAAKAAKAAAH